MALVEKYVSSLATGGGDGSQSSPWTIVEAFAQATAGMFIHVINDGVYNIASSLTPTNSGTVNAPIYLSGGLTDSYVGRGADGWLDTTKLPKITGSVKALNITKYYWDLRNLWFDTTGAANTITISGLDIIAENCLFTNSFSNSSTVAVVAGADSFFFNCDVLVTGATSTCAFGGDSNGVAYGCRFKNASTSSSSVARLNASWMINCVVDPSQRYGVYMYGNNCHVFGCTITGQSVAGIVTKNTSLLYPNFIVGNVITDCAIDVLSGYTSAIQPYHRLRNRVRDNTAIAGDDTIVPAFDQIATDTGGPETDFKDYANGDYTPIATSPIATGGYFGGALGALDAEADDLFTDTDRSNLTAALSAINAVADKLPATTVAAKTDVDAISTAPSASTIANAVDTLLTENHPGDWAATGGSTVSAPTVEEIDAKLSSAHGAGAWGRELGASPKHFVYTLTNSATNAPIADALVEVFTDSPMTELVTSGRTNAFGVVEFDLDVGTYYLRRRKAGFTFTNPDVEVVI